jgi:hypothetical protein
MKRFRFLPVIAAFLLVLPLSAQEKPFSGTSGGTLFTPFVSRLQGELKNNLLRLSWVDSPDAKGPLYIYFSSDPIEEGANLSRLDRPVEVPYGAQSYIYETGAPGTYHFFVVASEETGRRYELPVPFNNSISIVIEDSEMMAAAGSPAQASVQSSGIEDLEAVLDGDRIIITFDVVGLPRKSVLYRGVRPLKGVSDLVEAVIAEPDIASPFTDYPVPGIPYYYAVISEEELTRGIVGIFPGKNATTGPVEIPWGGTPSSRSDSLMRAIPLPAISLAAAVPGFETGDSTPQSETLSEEAARLLEDTIRPGKGASLMAPRAFSRDLNEEASGGEEYALRSIIKDPFTKRDWEQCRTDLQNFLSLPRSGDAEARARFYLGQCYYFLNMPRESLFEFLSAEDNYPSESAEWIKAVLAILSSGK